ncbi:hypothetical protein [Belliella aquatica]|uniref:Secreted protein n=1 Tax=Belliella aquatica TaxID=1323734 RepID=A0ABQ1LZL7_9BACT|nr:hypothetical protein [Belliella aquatica]MCH7405720.1 hypothetical protein [Belliella aquatica]GGC31272.1 hypothetical protein GCM10010993_07730 [Belliella aquatica]
MRKIMFSVLMASLFSFGFYANAACPGYEEVGDPDDDGYIIVYSEDQGDGSCKDCSDTCVIAV